MVSVGVMIMTLVSALAACRLSGGLVCANHVTGKSLVCLSPSSLAFISHGLVQSLGKDVHETFSHDGEHFGLDTVADVLGSKVMHDLGQELDVRAKHVEGSVDHLDKIRRVHQETLGGNQVLRLGVNVDGETEQDLGLGALLEETLEQQAAGDLFVVLDAAKLLPGLDDVADGGVAEFLNHFESFESCFELGG